MPKHKKAGVADFSYEIEKGRCALRTFPSQFHSRIKQCQKALLYKEQTNEFGDLLDSKKLLNGVMITGIEKSSENLNLKTIQI